MGALATVALAAAAFKAADNAPAILNAAKNPANLVTSSRSPARDSAAMQSLHARR